MSADQDRSVGVKVRAQDHQKGQDQERADRVGGEVHTEPYAKNEPAKAEDRSSRLCASAKRCAHSFALAQNMEPGRRALGRCLSPFPCETPRSSTASSLGQVLRWWLRDLVLLGLARAGRRFDVDALEIRVRDGLADELPLWGGS